MLEVKLDRVSVVNALLESIVRMALVSVWPGDASLIARLFLFDRQTKIANTIPTPTRIAPTTGRIIIRDPFLEPPANIQNFKKMLDLKSTQQNIHLKFTSKIDEGMIPLI